MACAQMHVFVLLNSSSFPPKKKSNNVVQLAKKGNKLV